MKQIVKSLVVIGAIVAAGSASADTMGDFSPYVGVQFKEDWMKPKSSWANIFPKDYAGASLFVGTKFHQNFGLELGYDWSANKKKDFTLASGSNFFSATVPAGGIVGQTKVRRTGGFLDVVGSLPVADCFELLGSVGFGWVQAKIDTTISTGAATNLGSAISSISGKGKGVFRVGVGASYMVTDMVGLRAKLGWESTSSLRIKGNQQFVNSAFDTKGFRGTTNLAIGGFVKF